MASISAHIGKAAAWIRFGLRQSPTIDRNVDFMILGIQKGGTTWLAQTLNCIPMLQRSQPKETRFFNARWDARYDLLPANRVRSDYLRNHWPTAREDQILFDASPGYLASSNASKRVKHYFPDVKGVVVLRDPVMRAFSNYNMWVRRGRYDRSFRELYKPLLEHVLECRESPQGDLDFYESVSQNRLQHVLSHGLYYYHLKIWFDRFPRDRFFIMTTKQLNDLTIYGDLLESIGVDREFIEDVPFDSEISGRHQGAPIEPEDQAELQAFYEPYNARLFGLLGVSTLDW